MLSAFESIQKNHFLLIKKKIKNQHTIVAFVSTVAFSIPCKQSTDTALHPSLLIIPDQVTLT